MSVVITWLLALDWAPLRNIRLVLSMLPEVTSNVDPVPVSVPGTRTMIALLPDPFCFSPDTSNLTVVALAGALNLNPLRSSLVNKKPAVGFPDSNMVMPTFFALFGAEFPLFSTIVCWVTTGLFTMTRFPWMVIVSPTVPMVMDFPPGVFVPISMVVPTKDRLVAEMVVVAPNSRRLLFPEMVVDVPEIVVVPPGDPTRLRLRPDTTRFPVILVSPEIVAAPLEKVPDTVVFPPTARFVPTETPRSTVRCLRTLCEPSTRKRTAVSSISVGMLRMKVRVRGEGIVLVPAITKECASDPMPDTPTRSVFASSKRYDSVPMSVGSTYFQVWNPSTE